MASDPVTLGLGVAGLGMQALGMNENRRQQNRAMSMQDQLVSRQIAVADRLQALHEQRKARGDFSPERALDMLNADSAKYESRDAGNLAGALRVAGYEPGDSEIGTRLDAVKEKYRNDRERMALDIRDRASAAEASSLAGASQPGVYSQAIQMYGDRAGGYADQYQPLDTSGISSVLREIFKKKPEAGGRIPVAKAMSRFRFPMMGR